jgi:hypothetical protein
MYLERAKVEDKDMTNRWHEDAQGIILFVSLHLSLRIAYPPD